MRQLSIPLTPPTDTRNGAPDLGFMATMLRVENPTPAYWYLPDSLRFIPPFHTGIAIPLVGTQQAHVLFQAPAGVSQNIPSNTPPGTAYFTYTDETGSGDAGVNLGGSAFGRSVKSRPLSIAYGNNDISDIFSTPSPDGFALFGLSSTIYDPNATLTISIAYPGNTGFTLIANLAAFQSLADGNPHLLIRSKTPIPALSIMRIQYVNNNHPAAFNAILMA